MNKQKLVSVLVAVCGALLLSSRLYVAWPASRTAGNFLLSLTAFLLIGNPLIVNMAKICREHGKFAWKESGQLRKNAYALLIIIGIAVSYSFL